jgi:hypothetical protein
MDKLRRDLESAFARQQAGLGSTEGARERLLARALSPAATRRKLLPRVAGAGATLLVAGTVAVVVLLTHGLAHQQTTAQGDPVLQALTAGAPAAVRSVSNRSFVWLIGTVVQPQGAGNQGGQWAGVSVNVMDWTGRVRYHFQIPHSSLPEGFNDIQAISADGTRALLDDGSVLNETGAIIGTIPSLKSNGPAQSHVRWMSDGRRVCAAVSNAPVEPTIVLPPKGQGTPPPRTLPVYAQPGADHSVTLKLFGLDGSVRTVATVGRGDLGEPSGYMPDSTSVLACNPKSDLVVVTRYHDADNNPADNSTTNMTVSLWAIKLSTGAVLYHQPETRMALGRAFFFGSENGALAVEFLWNSQVWGSETDAVLQIPSGHPVPVLEFEASPDTAGLSADGTRIIRRVVNRAGTQTDLKLIDASNGRVIRRVVIPTVVGAVAVAEPGGSSFIVQVENYLVLVDGDGGITQIHPALTGGKPSSTGPGVGLPSLPGLQG